jgi:hypothetical protein
MNKRYWIGWTFVGFGLISLLIVGTALAQEGACVPDDTHGCAQIVLSPADVTGDFFTQNQEEYTLLAQQQNVFEIGYEVPTPSTPMRFDILNIRDSSPEYGSLYVYDDSSANVWFTAGRTTTVTVTPRKQYIRGTLSLTCDIRNAAPEDSIACQVTIDEVPQEATLAPAQQGTYILDPGSHAVRVDVVGDLASLWTPATQEQTATITAGRTSTLRPRFDKMGHLTMALSQPGVVADFYVDDELAASQVETADLWVTPYRSHRVEARSTADPAANGVYRWRDAVSWVYLSPGQARTVTFYLQKQFVQGFFTLTCAITNLQPGDNAYCQPTIDDVPAAAVQPGTPGTFNLEPGAHHVRVVLGPEADWASEPQEWDITIYAGWTVSRTAYFEISPEPPVETPPPTEAPPPPTEAPPPPTEPPPPAGDMGTVVAYTQTGLNATCRIAISGYGEVVFLDAPGSATLQAGTYTWQGFLGPRGQTSQLGFHLNAGQTCNFTCYDTYVEPTCR